MKLLYTNIESIRARSESDTAHANCMRFEDVKMDFKPPTAQLKDLLQMICRDAGKFERLKKQILKDYCVSPTELEYWSYSYL